MTELTIHTPKRVCFWGAPAEVPKKCRVYSECLKGTSANTGNLFIGAGLYSATRAHSKDYWNFYGRSPEEFDEKFDALFVPASNFIFEYTDLSDQYEFFRKTKAQIFMFGLGSQLRQRGPIILPEGTRNFISLAADRCATIGVRGEITADVVKSLGISNIEVTGCPSMLSLPNSFSTKPNLADPVTVLSGNFTNNAREHAFSGNALKRIEGVLFHELVRLGGYYVLQNEAPEIFMMQVLPCEISLSEDALRHLSRIKELFSAGISEDTLIDYLRWNTRIFFQTKHWLDFMQGVDYSFGTRFHGNVAALKAGKPAFILCHDFRTLELAKFYKIPHSVIDDRSPTPSLEHILDRTEMDTFLANIPNLFKTWKEFVNRNGFDAKLQ